MIEIVHTYIKHFSLFTLASLIEKDEDFRLHLFIHEDDWDKNVVSWALANIENVKVYQSFWKGEEQEVRRSSGGAAAASRHASQAGL